VTEKVPTFQGIAIGAPLTKVKVFYDSDAEYQGCNGASHQLKACKADSDICKAREIGSSQLCLVKITKRLSTA
jgi:hypothetical protein